MATDFWVPITVTAPSGVDGFGEVAVLNGDPTAANFCGWVNDWTFAREVREAADVVPGADGGIHSSFLSGRLPFSMEIQMAMAANVAASNARSDKLAAAFNAQTADGKIAWTEHGRVATFLNFRLQQSLRGPGADGKVLVNAVSAIPLILADGTASSSAPGSGLTNGGKAATWPSFSFTSGASGNVVISRTSPGATQTLTLTIGGSSGLTASTATTVDFAPWNRTVLQGGANKRGAVQYPSSVWWAMAPGANTISVTGASSITVTWRSAWLP
jgi:hypothetical protein